MGDVETRELRAGELVIGLVLPAELRTRLPVTMSVGFRVETRDELLAVVNACGGIDRFTLSESATMLSLFGSDLTVGVHLRGDLAPVPREPTAALAELIAGGEGYHTAGGS